MTAAGAGLTIAATVVVAVFAVSVVRMSGIDDRPAKFVAGLIAAAGQLVLLAELLSLVSAFTVTGCLVGLAITSAATAAIAHRANAFRFKLPRFAPLRARVRGAFRFASVMTMSSPTTVAVAVMVSMILLVELALAILVAPNTFDSLSYHLTRAAYWIQNHSIAQFENATERQAVFPINVEVLQAWALAFAKGDRTVQLVQWVAQIGALAAVFAIARDIGATRRDALFAAAAAAATPVMIGQSTSSQNDLTTAFFAVAAVLFLVRYLRGAGVGCLVFAGVAFGLAVGAKSTALLAVPAFSILALVIVGRRWRLLVRPLIAFAVGALLFGAFNYAQNVFKHDSLTASPLSDDLRVQSPSEVPKNLIRIGWTSVFDSPGVTATAFDQALNKAARLGLNWTEETQDTNFAAFTLAVNHDTREDHVGLAYIGIFALLPCMLLALIRFRRRERLALALFSVSMFVLIACSLRYNIWIIRFLMPAMLVSMPLVAVIASRTGGRVWLLALIAASSFTMLLQNGNKPLVTERGTSSIVERSRIAQMTLQLPQEAVAIDAVDQTVPPDGRMGFIGDEDAIEYPFFGPNLERTIVKLTPLDLEPGVLTRYNLDAILISYPGLTLPPSLKGRIVTKDHTLVVGGAALGPSGTGAAP